MKTILLIILLAISVNADMVINGRITCYGNGLRNVYVEAQSDMQNGTIERRRGSTNDGGYYSIMMPYGAVDVFITPYSRECDLWPYQRGYAFPDGQPSFLVDVDFTCN